MHTNTHTARTRTRTHTFTQSGNCAGNWEAQTEPGHLGKCGQFGKKKQKHTQLNMDQLKVKSDLLAGDGVLYPLMGSPGRAGGDRLPSMGGKK